MKSAVVLLSGGLDSATILAQVKAKGFVIYALSFLYGQRHRVELESARTIASTIGVYEHKVVEIDLTLFGGSSLTSSLDVPKSQISLDKSDDDPCDIPNTYVPARNTLFLSYALAYAEVVGTTDIFIGANKVDYSNYPDCRPEYIEAFENLANKATKLGVQGAKFKIHAPLMELSKAMIIREGIKLGVDYSMTHSCYDPKSDLACGQCDSCILRRRGFEEALVNDPTKYA